ncbi:MAG: hypothetical protein J5717_07505 [Lachnospiraceae bacterium]|nr:hypothetical protein [Lachnospiraceae bacterium]
MEIKKKHIYRGIGGFLAAITLTTSVLPAFAFDKLPREYDGTNPYVITEQEPLSEAEMLALLETLRQSYEIAPVDAIETEPSADYVEECEEAVREAEAVTSNTSATDTARKETRSRNRNTLRLFAPRSLSEEIGVNTEISISPSVSSNGYNYTFDSLFLSEVCSDASELKKVVISLDGENFSRVITDISTTGITWNSGAINFSFEPEHVYRFLVEYTYERKVYDAPDVSDNQNSFGTSTNPAPNGTSGITLETDVSENESNNAISENDVATNNDISDNNPLDASLPLNDISGTDVSLNDADNAGIMAFNGSVADISTNDVSSNDVSGGEPNAVFHTETEVKKMYSVPFMVHKVRAGESLKTIASDLGVTVKTIRSDNGITWLYAKKGSLLYIRNPKADFVHPFDWNDEAIDKVTKLGAPKGTEFAYDAINLATLNLLYEEEDLAIKEKEAFTLVRYFYSGMPDYKGNFGYGVSSLFDERIIDISDDKKLVILKDMQGIILNKTGDVYKDSKGEYTLTESEDSYRLTDLSLNYTVFNLSGYVISKGTKKGELYRIEYDEDGNLQKLVSKAGKEFTVTLNDKGFISEIKNPDGTRKIYEYSEAGTLLKLTNERDFNRLYSFDDNKRLVSAKNPMGKTVITVSYNANGQVSSYTDAEGFVSTFSLNENATSFTDAKDKTVVYYKDDNNRHNRVLYSDGKDENKTFDIGGNILSETDRAGETHTYTYDSAGRLLTEAGSTGITATYTYDVSGNLLTEKDANGNVTTYEYDAGNNPISITYPNGTKTVMTFDGAGRMTSATTGESTTTYGYIGMSYNIATVTDSKGNVTENSYDAMDRLITTKEGGNTTTYEYSPTGKLLKETSPDGKTKTYEYDASDSSIGVTDPSGNKVGMRYDAMGRLVQVINADGSHTDFAYDANGNLVKEQSSTGTVKTYTYDANDEVTGEESSNGDSVTYERDAVGRVTKETYKDGTEVTYEYHPELGLVTKKKDELGRVATYDYDKVGNLLKESYSNGQFIEYTYDSMNRKTSSLDTKGIKTTYTYDAHGNILKETEEKNGKIREKTYEYDTNNNLIKETDQDGISVSFEYDSENRLVKAKDALGYTTTYTYGATGETLSETDRNGYTKYYEYDKSGNMTKLTDSMGNVYRYTYDSQGRVVSTTMPDGSITGAVYNTKGYMAKKVDPFGNVEEYTYDNEGNVLSVKNAEGAISTYTYDSKGNKLTETMPNGKVTKYAYNKLNWLTKVTYDNGTYAVYSYDYSGMVTKISFSNGLSDTLEYDSIGNLIKHIDKNGIITEFTYDDFGQILSVSDSKGTKEEYTYTKGGKSLTKVDELGRKITYEYDARGCLVKTVDSFGIETTYEYDGNENIVKITERDTTKKAEAEVSGNDVSGNVDISGNMNVSGNDISGNNDVSGDVPAVDDSVRITTFEYDKNNNIITTVSPDGNVERSTFDYNKNPLTVTDKNGNTTKNTYDALGRLIKKEAPTGDIVSYGYDKIGNTSYVKDAAENITSYAYDSMGQLIETTLPNGAKTKYTYDKDGNLITETNALSQTVKYEYNLDGNVVKKTYPNGIYEAYEYDDFLRVKSQTSVYGFKTSYEYDACGNVTKVLSEAIPHSYTKEEAESDVSADSATSGNVPSGSRYDVISTTYVYDELHRLIKEETEGIPATTYEYDKYGNVSKQFDGRNESLSEYDVRGNLIWSKSASGLETTYKYDKANNLTEVNSSGRTVRYEYDKAGNVLKIVNPDGTYTTKEYDALSRTISEKNELGNATSYTYDSAGNVKSITDALGRTSSYEYDSVGNLIREKHVDGTVTTYGYDALGTLIKTTDADGTSVFYTYDAMGNLEKETICDEEDYYAPVSGEKSRRESVYEYTKTGELKSRGGSGLDREHYAYYADGTLKEISYPSGKSIGYEYDNYGRNTVTYHNGKAVKTNTYNEYSELIKTKDETVTSEYSYDNLGRLIKAKNQAGEVKYTYDAFGNKESITYPDGKKVIYEYDIRNRISCVTDATGLKTEFTYDAIGNVLTKTQSDGLTTETTYDVLGRKLAISTKKATEEISAYEYSYDVAGRVSGEKSKDAEGVLFKSYEYDNAGKLTRYAETRNEEYFNNGFELLRSKDNVSAGDISGNTQPDVSANVSGNAPTGMSAIAIGSVSGNTSGRETLEDILKSHKDIQVITYEYDTFGNRIGETEYKDGLKSESKYIYDSLNHLEKKETNNKKVEGYKYDKDGNLITIEKPGNTKTFTYTIDNKLKDTYVNGSLTESATYDASGLKVTSTLKKEYNVTVTDITVNKEETKGKTRRYTTPYEEDNSYTETHIETIPGSEGYEYTEFVAEHEDEDMQWLADFVGIIAPAFSDSWHQYADSLTTEEYRTVSVEGTESTKKTTEVLHEDSVSGSDTYVKRTPGSVKEAQEESSHTETRTYYEKSYLVYDMTLSNPQVLSEESAPGTSRVNYTYAGEERLASSSLGSYVYDGRGSVKKVVNGSAVVRDYDYDPYGNITKGAPAQERMYGYNGEEYTPQTGLIYLRARHYNPSTATFTSEDTYAGDKTNPVTRNRYSYANNNPMMYKDPSGHRAVYLDVNNNPVIVNSKPSKTTVKATKTAAAAVAATVSAAKGVGAAVNKKTTTKTVTNPAKAEVQMATSVGNPSYAPSYSNPAGGNGAQRVVYINGRQYYFGGVNPIAKAINDYMHAPKTGDYTSYAKGEATPAKAVKQRIGWSSHMRSTVVLGEAIGNAIETNAEGLKSGTKKAVDTVLGGLKWFGSKVAGAIDSVSGFLHRHSESTDAIEMGVTLAAAGMIAGTPKGKLTAAGGIIGAIINGIRAGVKYHRGEISNPDGMFGAIYDGVAEGLLGGELIGWGTGVAGEAMTYLLATPEIVELASVPAEIATETGLTTGGSGLPAVPFIPTAIALPVLRAAIPRALNLKEVTAQIVSQTAEISNAQTEKLSGGYLRHVNGSIAEIQGYNQAIASGEKGIQKPGKVTAPGPDYITYDAESGYINVYDAKYSFKGIHPTTAKGFGTKKWMIEILEAINELADPELKALALDAYNKNMIAWRIFPWP